MTESSADPLEDETFLDAFLDTLIPPVDRMPGAGSLGVASALRKQIASNAMLAAPASAALAALRASALERDPGGLSALSPAAREEVLSALMPQQPVLGMVQFFVVTSYYQHPTVLEALGQPARPPFPKGYEIEPTDTSLLAKLATRQRK
jgi:hypothetical protein